MYTYAQTDMDQRHTYADKTIINTSATHVCVHIIAVLFFAHPHSAILQYFLVIVLENAQIHEDFAGHFTPLTHEVLWAVSYFGRNPHIAVVAARALRMLIPYSAYLVHACCHAHTLAVKSPDN